MSGRGDWRKSIKRLSSEIEPEASEAGGMDRGLEKEGGEGGRGCSEEEQGQPVAKRRLVIMVGPGSGGGGEGPGRLKDSGNGKDSAEEM